MRWFFALLVFASSPLIAFSQDQPAASDPLANFDPFGFDFARFLCEGESLKMVTVAEARMFPHDSVFVFLGQVSGHHMSVVDEVLERRGSVLFATDQLAVTKQFQISRRKLPPVSDAVAYQNHNDCFLATPLDEAHPVTRGVENIAFNRPAWIRVWSGWVNLLARSPERELGLMGVYDRPGSRMLVMSDHSPFTNQMLLHADNAILLVNTINWLSEGGRKRVAFVVDGNVVGSSNMNPMLPPDDIPPIDPADVSNDTKLAIANRFLREAQKDNAFNRLLALIPSWRVWQVLIVASVIILGFIFFRRLIRSHAIIAPPTANAATPSEARAFTMLKRQTLYPVACELAKSFIRRIAGLSPDSVTPEITRTQVWVDPAFNGSPKRIQAEVAKLSRLAGALDQPKQLKPKHLRKLAAQIEELTAMHDAGQLRLQALAATT